MAPVRTLTKNEAQLRQNPWLTFGILQSIKSRDQLHRRFLKAKNPAVKERLFNDFKNNNLITSSVYK